MIKLQPNEQILTGAWLVQDGRARGDAVCERIDWMIAHHLQKIADNARSGAWETLYRDPEDGRYWERMAAIGNGLIRKAKCTAADRHS